MTVKWKWRRSRRLTRPGPACVRFVLVCRYLTSALREESEGRLTAEIKVSELSKNLSLTRVKLEDAVAQNHEYGALLKLVRLRKNLARKEAMQAKGHENRVYEVDIEGSLVVNNKAKRELQQARCVLHLPLSLLSPPLSFDE